MPTTRTGRQSSPSKQVESPSKTRVQPMRGARLRSASPFFDAAGASTSATVSQQSSQDSSPSKTTRSSQRKKPAASSSSLPTTSRRSTRSRSRSVGSEALSDLGDGDDDPVADQSREAEQESHPVDSTSPEPRLAPIAEEAPAMALSHPPHQAHDNQSDASTSSSDSDSDDSNSDSSSMSSSEEDEADDGAPDLDALLKASQQAYKSRASVGSTQSRFEDNSDVISFDADDAEGAQAAKRTSKVIPLVVRAKLQMAKAQSATSRKEHGASKDHIDKQIEALDQSELSANKKKSKHARTVQTSAGSNWFDMPEFGASSSKLAALKKQSAADSGHSKASGGDARLASADQLRREVQALRLRNALDPKRFYRASAKNAAMPKFAQLGKIIASPLEPKAVLSRQERGRTVVEELIRDAEAASYAKRKFSESQASHKPNYNGRRKPPSKKRRA